jgi:UDP-N-acetyl-D-glucosamine dehydrogenase
MPNYVVDRVTDALNHAGKPVKNSRIGILGVAYKKDIDDHRESPSFKLMELLIERGGIVTYCDPHIPRVPAPMRSFDVPQLNSENFAADYLNSLDCAVIATDHSCFDYEFLVHHSKIVVDARNATRNVVLHRERIWRA